MKARSHQHDEQHLTEQLGATGLRLTPQRQQVYDVLLHKRDHPTAEEVFIRAKKTMPEISHATVYNCLDALVKCGLAWQVDRKSVVEGKSVDLWGRRIIKKKGSV